MKRSQEIANIIKVKSQALEILQQNYIQDMVKLTAELMEILDGHKPDIEIYV